MNTLFVIIWTTLFFYRSQPFLSQIAAHFVLFDKFTFPLLVAFHASLSTIYQSIGMRTSCCQRRPTEFVVTIVAHVFRINSSIGVHAIGSISDRLRSALSSSLNRFERFSYLPGDLDGLLEMLAELLTKFIFDITLIYFEIKGVYFLTIYNILVL